MFAKNAGCANLKEIRMRRAASGIEINNWPGLSSPVSTCKIWR